MLTFDPKTYLDWKNRNIKTISIEFINSGCEGTSIRIIEDRIESGYQEIPNQDPIIITYSTTENKITLRDAYITKAKGKWIMRSDAVLTRCGCGKSFGIAT